jgi:hypothetical protein
VLLSGVFSADEAHARGGLLGLGELDTRTSGAQAQGGQVPMAAPGPAPSHRDQVAREIMESEKSFVGNMTTLVSVFLKPLKWWDAELKASYGKVSCRLLEVAGQYHTFYLVHLGYVGGLTA